MADWAKISVELSLANAEYLKKISESLAATNNFSKQASQSFASLGNILSVGALAGAFALITKHTEEFQKAQTQLYAVLQSTNGASGVTAERANKLAEEYEKLTTIQADNIVQAEVMLLRFTNIKDNVFPQATLAALNLSAALGKDLNSAALMVGKALQDPINGMTALRKAGVQLSAAQQEQIISAMKVGDVYRAQTILLAELEKKYGGTAAAAADTLAGAFNRLANIARKNHEEIGSRMTPGIIALSKAMEESSQHGGIFFTLMGKIGDAISFVAYKAAQTITILNYASDFLAGKSKEAQKEFAQYEMQQKQVGERIIATYGNMKAAREKAMEDTTAGKIAKDTVAAYDNAQERVAKAADKIAGTEDNFISRMRKLDEDYVKDRKNLFANLGGTQTGYDLGKTPGKEINIEKMIADIDRFIAKDKELANIIKSIQSNAEVAKDKALAVFQAQGIEGIKAAQDYAERMTDINKSAQTQEITANITYYTKKIHEATKYAQEAMRIVDAVAAYEQAKADEKLKRLDQQEQVYGQFMEAQKQQEIEAVEASADSEEEKKKKLDAINKKYGQQEYAVQLAIALMRYQMQKAAFEQQQKFQEAQIWVQAAAGAVGVVAQSLIQFGIWGLIPGALGAAAMFALAGIQEATIQAQHAPPFQPPSAPSYEAGAWEIPQNQTAFLHKKEMIVSAPFAEKFRENVGQTVVIPIHIGDTVIDTVVYDSLKRTARRAGGRALSFKVA